MKTKLLFATLLISLFSYSQTLDNTFNGSGIVTKQISFSPSKQIVTDSEVQSDGKIVYVGSYNSSYNDRYIIFVSRYNPDGTIDTSFNRHFCSTD